VPSPKAAKKPAAAPKRVAAAKAEKVPGLADFLPLLTELIQSTKEVHIAVKELTRQVRAITDLKEGQEAIKNQLTDGVTRLSITAESNGRVLGAIQERLG
jgi:hypothetical protein